MAAALRKEGTSMDRNTVQPDDSSKEVYLVSEIAEKLQISERGAYNFCNTTKLFTVLRCGRSIRVLKQSFDDWFYHRSAAEDIKT